MKGNREAMSTDAARVPAVAIARRMGESAPAAGDVLADGGKYAAFAPIRH
jgi:hypothetical protein